MPCVATRRLGSTGQFRGLVGALPHPVALANDSLENELCDLRFNEIAQLERFVVEDAGGDTAARAKALKKLALVRTRIESRYYEQALRKLST